MPIRSMKRRLAEVRRAGIAKEIGTIVIISPDEWPEEVRDAYDVACASRDEALQADIIATQTGERPDFSRRGITPIRGRLPPAVIAVRYVDSGPR